MNCVSIQEDLSAYQGGELTPLRSREIEVHLTGCVSCQDQLNRFREIWKDLGSIPTVEPSVQFRTQFWQKVREEEDRTPVRGWFPWIKWVPTAAVAMMLWGVGIVGGVTVFNRHLGTPGTTGKAIQIFTSPVPPNSVEEIFLRGPGHSDSHRGGV